MPGATYLYMFVCGDQRTSQNHVPFIFLLINWQTFRTTLRNQGPIPARSSTMISNHGAARTYLATTMEQLQSNSKGIFTLSILQLLSGSNTAKCPIRRRLFHALMPVDAVMPIQCFALNIEEVFSIAVFCRSTPIERAGQKMGMVKNHNLIV